MRRFGKILIGVLGISALAIQWVPVARDNPPVEDDFKPPPPVAALLRRACYDCHSHETRWPWYAHVAPISWSVARHVRDGREAVNFSLWSQGEQEVDELLDEVREGSMPPRGYVWAHAEARLTAEDIALLRRWVEAGGPAYEGAEMP